MNLCKSVKLIILIINKDFPIPKGYLDEDFKEKADESQVTVK